ncbi:hypothetical protein H7F37_04170 [Winogradskyella sp. PAMC22761]|nr:hypothetical protein H7F37_04170 [Winogradskyella sp. PAMC22761]
MKYLFAIIFSFSFLTSYSQMEPSESGIEFEKSIKENDTISLIKHHRKFDSDFSSDWKLNETETRVEIDHFKYGYNIEWIKRKSDTIIYRTYTFDIDGNFYYGHEKRELNDKLVSRGGIEIENGKLKYIRQVYPKEIEPKFKVDYYEFELFDKGKLVAIYRADHLNHYYMLTEEKNKDKIKLVYGIDFLNVKK